ncbi:hypothetical protein SCWH03_58460 [Streptomyces pacificus]|uniref:Uncharacterized protein n=1 Tax=Streptomyces pacificus TaxID=2705029 RepID=A0A6A0B517_9ACTN|nr:hypothetical protein SCWH03_58460 [Streptomyces pacificus]
MRYHDPVPGRCRCRAGACRIRTGWERSGTGEPPAPALAPAAPAGNRWARGCADRPEDGYGTYSPPGTVPPPGPDRCRGRSSVRDVPGALRCADRRTTCYDSDGERARLGL